MTRVVASLGVSVILASLAACSGGEDEGKTSAPATTASACSEIAIDRWKELLIVDEAVTGDARASNRASGPWSFRALIERLVPAGQDPSTFVLTWLRHWETNAKINLFDVPLRIGVKTELTCPWLKRTPANACNDDCSVCTEQKLDLGEAPFRLLAVTNRLELRETEGAPQGRFAFGLFDGPADDPASQPRQMTLGIEYLLPLDTATTTDWANRFHALGAHPAFDASYLDALEKLTDSFTGLDGTPPKLSQIRTNERVFEWDWNLRQFQLAPGSGAIVLSTTTKTPDQTMNGGAELVQFVKANRQAILEDRFTTPSAMTGGFSIAGRPWRLPGVDQELRDAFAKATCDGCHQEETAPVDVNFHVSPFKKGIAKVSPFLNTPGSNDELAKRAASMQRALCGH